MNISLKCARFPFCNKDEKECKIFIKRGIEYELKRKTEQKESESFQKNLMNMDLVQGEDSSIME